MSALPVQLRPEKSAEVSSTPHVLATSHTPGYTASSLYTFLHTCHVNIAFHIGGRITRPSTGHDCRSYCAPPRSASGERALS
jgi:hypothetical protein